MTDLQLMQSKEIIINMLELDIMALRMEIDKSTEDQLYWHDKYVDLRKEVTA